MIFQRSTRLETYNNPPKKWDDGRVVDPKSLRSYLANFFVVDAYSATHNAVPYIYDGEGNTIPSTIVVARFAPGSRNKLVEVPVTTLQDMNPVYLGPSEMRYYPSLHDGQIERRRDLAELLGEATLVESIEGVNYEV